MFAGIVSFSTANSEYCHKQDKPNKPDAYSEAGDDLRGCRRRWRRRWGCRCRRRCGNRSCALATTTGIIPGIIPRTRSGTGTRARTGTRTGTAITRCQGRPWRPRRRRAWRRRCRPDGGLRTGTARRFTQPRMEVHVRHVMHVALADGTAIAVGRLVRHRIGQCHPPTRRAAWRPPPVTGGVHWLHVLMHAIPTRPP